MAKGQQALQRQILQQQAQQDKTAQEQLALQKQQFEKASTPSAAESQQEIDRKKYFEWRDAGDYSKPPPGLIGLNYGQAAQERRALEQSAVPTGAYGMGAGYASPTALALQRDYLNNVNAESDANNYEGAVRGEDLYQRTGSTGALENLDMQRKFNLLGTASDMTRFFTNSALNYTQSAIQNQPQPMLPALLGGALGAAGQLGAAAITKGAI